MAEQLPTEVQRDAEPTYAEQVEEVIALVDARQPVHKVKNYLGGLIAHAAVHRRDTCAYLLRRHFDAMERNRAITASDWMLTGFLAGRLGPDVQLGRPWMAVRVQLALLAPVPADEQEAELLARRLDLPVTAFVDAIADARERRRS